jgi:CheY-like chemotaxis protein
MDIKMPDLNGFEALEVLRKKKYKKPIIAVTGYGMEEERERLLKSSFDAYVAKPFNEEELIRLILKIGNTKGGS